MTGLEFSNIFDLKIDKAYSGFLNPTKKNRLFKEALVLSIENKYKDLQSQKSYDEITMLIKTNQPFAPVSNQVSLITTGTLVTDYEHLLAIKAKFLTSMPGLTVTGATNTTPIILSVNALNVLRTGNSIVVSGVFGNSAANGTHFLKRISRKKFELYSDITLLTPVAGNGNYVSGGTIQLVNYNYCRKYYSDQKISTLGIPTVDAPKFEITQNLIKIYPLEYSCSEVNMDYIKKSSVFITSTDNVIDLEDTYPVKFLYYVSDVASQLFSESIKDQELFQTSTFETKTNS